MVRRNPEPIVPHPYPEFRDALVSLAPSDIAAAKLLRVSRHTISGWRHGRNVPDIRVVGAHPRLLAALGRDLITTASQGGEERTYGGAERTN